MATWLRARVTEDEAAEVKRQARAAGQSVSELIREALGLGVAR